MTDEILEDIKEEISMKNFTVEKEIALQERTAQNNFSVDTSTPPPTDEQPIKNSSERDSGTDEREIDIKFTTNNCNTNATDCHAENNSVYQNLSNLPEELLRQPRFFPATAAKIPKISEWQKPDNQKLYTDIALRDEILGFDCTGHGGADDYCLLDFDHVLTDKGEFVNEEAKDLYELIVGIEPGIYCEKSCSGRGLHILLQPTANKFGKISNGKNGVYHFDRNIGAKLEIFYLNEGRYCLLTGNLYNCRPNAEILSGEVADSLLNALLKLIKEQNKKSATNNQQQTDKAKRSATFSGSDNEDYDKFRAGEMLECIEPSELNDADWLAVISAAKNLGFDYAEVDIWCSRDKGLNPKGEPRYNEKNNFNRWDSVTDPSFNIETLHGIAKRFGYSERETKKKWLDQKSDDDKRFDEDFILREEKTANDKNSDGEGTDGEGKQKLNDRDKFLLFSMKYTDLFNSRRILIVHGDNIRFATDSGKWYTFDNSKGIWIDGGKENQAVMPYALNVADLINKNYNPRDEKGTEEKLAKQWQARKTISNAIELMKGEDKIRITAEDFNRHKNLLNCKNGVVDLETGLLYPHNSKLLLTQCVNAEYRAGLQNDDLNKFLKSILPDEETLQSLLRFLGYCLTGEVNEEKALFIYGRGGNGKGTLTKMLLSLMNEYACSFPIESILMQPYSRADGDSATPAFNKLLYRRVAIAEEIPAGKKLDYAKFKLITGGDPLPIRRLHQEATEIKDPVHKFIFSGNHLPELDDTHDPGILRRWVQVPFEQDFTLTGDPKLKQKLQTPEALSALLSILVQNAVSWYKEGWVVSGRMKSARDNYFAENDFISEFITEYCQRGEGLKVKRKDLLDKLKETYKAETFGKSERELQNMILKVDDIFYKRGTGKVYWFYSIALRGDEEQTRFDNMTIKEPSITKDAADVSDNDLPF